MTLSHAKANWKDTILDGEGFMKLKEAGKLPDG